MKTLRLSFILLSLLLTHAIVPAAFAHPLGNFTINHSATLRVSPEIIRVEYVLDMAEIPAFQQVQTIDTNHNGQPDATETKPYRSQQCGMIGSQLTLSINGRATSLNFAESAISFPPGAGNLPTLRLICHFNAPILITPEKVALTFSSNAFADRLGWREIVVLGDDVTLEGEFASASMSEQLTAYPEDMLASPLDERQVSVTVHLGSSGISASSNSMPAFTSEVARRDTFTQLITLPGLTPLTLLLALGIALAWGAAHALTPGHGKAIVGAYLVGARGTAKHALYLGLTTTLTHTVGVFALGLVTLFASEYILPEALFPWLSAFSGLLVVGLGISLLINRVQALRANATYAHVASLEHEHGPNTHTHLPSETNGAMTWRSVLALGVSGGLIPCPSALVVLLGAIALNRVGLGLALVLAFSIGLAGALTLIGLMLVYARQWFERFPARLSSVRYISIGSAGFITLAGLGMLAQALAQIGLFA